MPNIDDLGHILDAATERLNHLKNQLFGAGRNPEIRRALNALLVAVEQTKIAINLASKSAAKAEQRSEYLSELWQTASESFRNIDQDLANRFQLKGDYWLNPGQWTLEGVQEANISLRAIEKVSNQMLKAEYGQ